MSSDSRAAGRQPEQQARKWWFAAALVVAIILLGNIQLVIARAAPQWDAVDFFGPEFSLVADHIKHGRLLMWDPWVCGGAPDFAEPELGTISPLTLLLGLLSLNPWEGFVAYWLALWIMGGLGFLLLARHLGSPVWGALVVTLGYVTSGFYTGHAEHTSSLCSIAYLPWVLWRFDLAIQRRSYWHGVQAGVLYGLSALGGYPELTILTPGFLGLWACGRVLAGEERVPWKSGKLPELVRAGALLLMVSVIGLVVCSPSHIALIQESKGYSDRVGPRPRQKALSSNRMPAQAAATFASPYVAVLNMPPNQIWPITDVSMTGIYMGVLSFGFAMYGWRWQSPWRNWLLVMALFFGCCAVGSELPVRGWLYDYVPPTRYFRNPALFREYVILTLAVLALLATRDLDGSPERRSNKRFLPLTIVLALAAFAALWITVRMKGGTPGGLNLAIAHAVVLWLSAVAMAYQLAKPRRPGLATVRLLVLLACADALGTLVISKPTLYSEAYVPWWRAMNVEHVKNLDLTAHGLLRSESAPPELATYYNNRNVTLKAATLDSYVTLTNRFHLQMITLPGLRGMAIGSERTWFSAHPAWLAPTDAAFARLADEMPKLGGPPMILHSVEQMKSFSSEGEGAVSSNDHDTILEACSRAAISNISYRANSLSFHYRAGARGWLMVTDRWSPSWIATVNGRDTPILGADFLFRAVPVEIGENAISFRFKPAAFPFLLAASWGTLLAVAGCEIGRKLRARG